MIIKTQDLKGIALDWAVLKCEIGPPCGSFLDDVVVHPNYSNYHPSTCWTRGGPIIERERISTDFDYNVWNAAKPDSTGYYSAETPLIAAMRCYVASKLGYEIDVPDNLLQ